MGKWIQKIDMKKGALTKKAEAVKGGVKNGKITAKGMQQLSKSNNPTTKKQVSLANELKKFK